MKRTRFVTLTLKTTTEPLLYLLQHLYDSFSKLRRTKLWRGTQTGGVAFLEIKWNPNMMRWHPHLHILTEGKYIAHPALSKAWLKCTGSSFVVHVTRVNDAARAAAYVVKYASKPHDPSVLKDFDRLKEAIVALRGRKLCLTYGTWRGVKLTEVPDQGEWEPVAPLATIITQARNGDDAARSILSRLPQTPFSDDCRPPPDEAPDDADVVSENGDSDEIPF